MFTADQTRSAAMARRTVVGRTAARCLPVIILIAFLGMTSCVSEEEGLLRSKERVLKQDLFVLREQIDNYTLDEEKAPQSLQDLVATGYLKEIPSDPFTGSNKTWVPVTEDIAMSIDQTETGITDVHSGSNAIASDGTPYASW
jgi:general secretion pathway protein G